MENQTEYILIKEITAKENRKNLFKVIGYSALSGIFGIGVMSVSYTHLTLPTITV